MSPQTQSREVFRFGTFEVDLRAGELRKQGVRIKLQEQPFQVLTILLQSPGEVVTRDELRSQIWSADTFVDFDNSLNTSINKLREALGDSAESPRFIETLPRRGYRFIAPVSGNGKGTAISTAPTSAMHRWKIALLLLVFLGSSLGGGLFWRTRQSQQLTEKDTIVLADFANTTGDPVFDGTLREGLSVELEQSPFLSLVSDEQIHETLRMMRQNTNRRLTPEIAQEVCQRTSSAGVLEGSIALIGTRYNLILKAVSCADGRVLASTDAQANDKNHVLDALGKIASVMRRKLGESLSTLQKYNTPLEQATTSSLEALQAYSLGFQAFLAADDARALPFFQKAVELDPNFAMAYWATSLASDETAVIAENGRKAFALGTGVSEREKFRIEINYYYSVIGDLLKTRRICEVGAQMYPRDWVFVDQLRIVSNALGQYEEGLKASLEMQRLVPPNIPSYRSVVYAHLLLNRVEEAAAVAKEAHERSLDSNLAGVVYGIAFYRNDAAEMARQVDRAAGKPGEEDLVLALEADTAAYFGHLEKAREFSRLASDSARGAGKNETAATYDAVAALREALFGNANARREAAMVSRPPPGRDMDYALALAFAYAGDGHRSQVLADELGKRFPEDTVMLFNFLPTLGAKLALLRSKPQQALQLLDAATPYELGLPALDRYNWPNLYPVYVRGEAYLAAHQGSEAAAEFQKILAHRGIVLNEPIGALAHLGLGRAYAIAGDPAQAKSAFQDFFTLWKDADPDIPVLKQAKAEYAKLQ